MTDRPEEAGVGENSRAGDDTVDVSERPDGSEAVEDGEAADGFDDNGDVDDLSLDLTTPRGGSNGTSLTNGNTGVTNGDAATNGDDSPPKTDGSAPANGTSVATNGASESAGSGSTSTDGQLAVESGLLADPAAVDETGADDEVEPVELLVQLAEDGDIDPWDIDIVAVTDAFLERLDESDLRTSGRALFYASVLLRMKSDAILAPDDPEPAEPWEAETQQESFGYDPIDALESEMDRRLDRKHARGSPETLDELVRELREAEHGSWWKEGRTYDTSASPHGYNRGTQTLDYHSADDFRDEGEPGEADVTGTAHTEDIETTIAEVETALRTQYDKGRDEVLFAEIRRTGGRPFQTFLALLFLAHRGVVRLQQDDLFGDLWVQNPAAVAVGDEAIAD